MSEQRKLSTVLLAALVVGPLACAHRGVASDPAVELPAANGPLLGTKLPAFEGPTVNGRRFFSGDGAGRVMVVYFFDSTSARSRRPLRGLQELALSRADEVMVVAISRDKEVSAARSLATEYDLTFPVLHDKDGALATRFGVSQPTATFVISRYRQVEWAALGELPQDAIGRAALAVLQGSTRTLATK